MRRETSRARDVDAVGVDGIHERLRDDDDETSRVVFERWRAFDRAVDALETVTRDAREETAGGAARASEREGDAGWGAEAEAPEAFFDVLVVGCGLSGCTIAERCANELGLKVLIIDKRDHVGGNCYDYVDEKCAIRRSMYGAHLFHTKHERVWEYVQRFSEWIPYEHRVRGRVMRDDGKPVTVPIPPTRETVNKLFDEDVRTDAEMEAWYGRERQLPPNGDPPANGEEAALARVGERLYEKVFRHYTKKQWDKEPKELDASVLQRLPCRVTADDRYFSDPHQALPRRGYTRVFENMLTSNDLITVRLECDYFELLRRGKLPRRAFTVYTGPIDGYYASLGMPRLEYRSLRFEEEYINDTPADSENGYFFQEAMVVNYPGSDVDYTRIVAYKLTPNQPPGRKDRPGTVIVREYSSDVGEPYYPVPTSKNRELYEKYAELAAREPHVAFVGRLASYKYFNMDEAVLNALEMFDNLKEKGVLAVKRPPSEF